MKAARLLKQRFLTTLAGIAFTLSATAGTWDGGSEVDSNTGTDENWVGNELPSATGAAIIFDGNTRTSVFNNYLTSVGSMTFASEAGAFTFSGDSIEVASGTIFRNDTSLVQTIETNITGTGNRTFRTLADNTSTLVVSGGISGSGTLTFNQTSGSQRGTVILSGDNSFTGIFSPDTSVDLVIQNADSIKNMSSLRGSSGAFHNDTGAPLTTTAWLDIRNSIIFGGGNDITMGRLHLHRAARVNLSTVTVQAGTTVTFTNADYTGNVDAILRKVGGGTLVLNNMNMS